ncbi:MAG: bifunctional [glutamate--ammonia ligase]-adenylyl-L-tyrosine phosphorylase/[glutamate--ammonia-ligase] adenylyltransferase [Chromatiales bacterium]|nr:MAG: bifunctional [glutamate--ammonia ligase]-adenylyl-L-tyrosine phosphorylase/[glutamate--ammonia-ligase] adenylyltransferase [Chromatiales bacterium]
MSASLETLPDILHEPVTRWLERYGETGVPSELVQLVACSEFAGHVVLREKRWFQDNVAAFSHPPATQHLEAFVTDIGNSRAGIAEVQSRLRIFRNRFLLQVLWREVFGLASLDETLASLSLLADRLLDAACQYAEGACLPRYGVVRDAAGSQVPLVVLGMGKLGGRELNFSSDIDLIFLYPEAGETDGPRKISAQEYFGRLTRQVIALLDESTVDGFVFRIDTRLRPFGDSGPPVVSFGALESYLLQHGRDWERYAYVKARVVGPMPGDAVVADLHRNLIQPFVYRRYIDFGVFESLREMHAMIAAEVKRHDLQGNVKLGPGGIREAEFVVQSLQLVRGGSEPALQSRELQKVLPLLVSNRGLSEAGAQRLREGYRFMRRLENFIQAIRDRQTHELPTDETDRARLCLAMGYANWDSLASAIDAHRDAISSQFEEVAFRDSAAETPLHKHVEQAWKGDADAAAWRGLFEEQGIRHAQDVASALASFANESATRQIDAASRERLQRFIPLLVSEVAKSDRPLRAMTRTLSVVERILRRSAYLALLNENHAALARLVDLCARSHYISDQIARYPALLDELLDPRLYSEAVTKSELAADLDARLASAQNDSEASMKVIGQFHRSTMFRIAVADFNGQLPIMKVSDGLTWLAEAVLQAVLRVAWSDLADRHGVPRYRVDGVEHEVGFGIIAYGKLGGLELSYGSDLDIVFLHNATGAIQTTDGDKPLDSALFFSRLVRRLVHFLTTQTGSGQLYEIDTRLRPDGGKGLLVTSTEAFERYQDENAWTWEHQALLRARAVAGSTVVAAEFERIRRETLIGRVRRDQLRADVVEMRQRMRRELDRSDRERFDLKHGRGGIGDIEFLVQYRVLDQAQRRPAVIEFSDNIRQLDALVAEGCMAADVGRGLQDAYRGYRLRQHHLVLDDQPPLVAAGEFEEERAFVAKTWDDWLG